MEEIDEMLENGSQQNNYKSNRNYQTNRQNNWINKQNQDRQAIYDTMDRMALIVANDSEKFQEYLDVQSKFEKYSVGNCLVIQEKAPYSTQIKDKQSWNEKGVQVKRNAKEIKILEPNYSNGKTYYNPKIVYDISQTNAPKQDNLVDYDNKKLLAAIIYNCKIPRVTVDKLDDGTIGAEYKKDENKLYVCRGMDWETLFPAMWQEMAKMQMQDEKDSDIKTFRSYCVSYMMCQKYEVDVLDYDFSNLPREIVGQKDTKAIRQELDIIKSNFEELNGKMLDFFEQEKKEKNKSVPER